MKKLTTLLFLTGFIAFSFLAVNAQDSDTTSTDAVFEEAAAEETAPVEAAPLQEEEFAPQEPEQSISSDCKRAVHCWWMAIYGYCTFMSDPWIGYFN